MEKKDALTLISEGKKDTASYTNKTRFWPVTISTQHQFGDVRLCWTTI